MDFLDVRTLVFSNVVTDILCLLVILLLWRQSRKRFAGTGFWVFDFVFQTVAVFLVVLRGGIPDWMSMVIANSLVIGGAILGYMGLGCFVGRKTSQVHNYLLLAAFACVHAYFALVQPNLAARNLNLSAGLLIICFQCMWLLVYGVESGMRRLTLGVGMVFGVYCLVSIVRIVGFFTRSHAANNYFQSGAFESLILISYQMLFILLTYSLALMVNKRLLVEVTTQEEKFAKAFRSSPYAITLTRLSDGQILEVNDGFSNISGYPYAEVIGKATVDLHLWDKEEDRAVAVNALSKSGKVRDKEFQFRKKSGERITGLFSADIIRINDQDASVTSLSARRPRNPCAKASNAGRSPWQALETASLPPMLKAGSPS
jgi:PAS domain S-box-containing protein